MMDFPPERRKPFALDAEKFSTQRLVTFVLLTVYAGVVCFVMLGTDQSERSMILQTVINLTILAAGYWLGSSKAATDSNQAVSDIAKAAAPAQAAAVAAATATAVPTQPLPPTTGVTP